MIVRQKYLDQLLRFRDRDLVKVVTGVRRCGKSTLLDMAREALAAEGVPRERLLTFRMESMEFDGIGDYRDLYAIVRERAEGVERPYLFFDELQQVEGWERAINSLRVDMPCDIYVTGSNAFLLSSELATYLSGRYVEVGMLPLTFAEYLDFRGAEWFGADGPRADLVALPDGGYGSLQAMLDQYRRFGGMPFLALSEPDVASHRAYMSSLYDTVIVRDILERDRRRGRRQVTNADLLRRLCAFLADNVGNESSVNSIAGTIRAEGSRVANDTVDAYMGALREAYLFYRARRYDIRGRELLKTGGKHYLVDVGLRSFLQGYRDADQGRVFENVVYLQLLYDGYSVSVGRLRAGEVDFVATRGDERLYLQVTEDMTDPATMERELAPLRAVRDSYPKAVVVMRGSYPTDVDGIRIVPAADFLLHRRR
ncbi:ATP-binding protein [Thermophilibacter mediterraneus]|uniref:ATP-binding protein n=1 Tax=Thermophilibacter mediterraneus TaxID=1871031 RepID=UPI003D18A9A4